MTATFSPYTAGSLIGKWVLFLDNGKVVAYGLCTGNTTTTLTINSPVNGTQVLTNGKVLILGDPVLDYVRNLEQGSPVATFTVNKARTSAIQNAYEFNDKSDKKLVVTKMVLKAKSDSETTASSETTKKSITVTKTANNKWIDEDGAFENSTILTHRSMGVPTLAPDGNDYAWGRIYLKGTNYSFNNGDYIYQIKQTDPPQIQKTQLAAANATAPIESGVYVGVNSAYEMEGYTLLTPVSGSSLWSDADLIIGEKVYVQEPFRLLTVGTAKTGCYIGTESAKIFFDSTRTYKDNVFGRYIKILLTTDFEDMENLSEHTAGAPIYNDTEETTPNTLSPVGMFGVKVDTTVPDTGVTRHFLEAYAINALTSRSFYYRKGSMWCFIRDWFKQDPRIGSQICEASWIREGDMIGVLQKTGDTIDDVEYNQKKNLWQVVSWTLDADTMKVNVELGDYERNVFNVVIDRTVANTNAIN